MLKDVADSRRINTNIHSKIESSEQKVLLGFCLNVSVSTLEYKFPMYSVSVSSVKRLGCAHSVDLH
jgi:hypothetical protein